MTDQAVATAALELADGIELCHALTARVAENIGARALAIKGLVSEAHGLRTPRASADVDVLVDPARQADLVEALLALGWRKSPTPPVPPAFGYHSVTLNHPSWPCELDVHDRFPGFLGDPAEVFEVLWRGHTFVVAGDVAVPATGRYESALIIALHALRNPNDPRSARELRELVDRLASRSVDGDRLRALAAATGSLATARPFLAALGVRVDQGDEDGSVTQWELRRTIAQTRNLGWLMALRRSPLRRWPALVLAVALSNEPMLRLRYPKAPAGRRGLWLARWWRVKQAVPELPRALRTVRRIR